MEGQPFPTSAPSQKWWKSRTLAIGALVVLAAVLMTFLIWFVFNEKAKSRILEDEARAQALDLLSGGGSAADLSPQEEKKVLNSLAAPSSGSGSPNPPPSTAEKKKILDSLGSGGN